MKVDVPLTHPSIETESESAVSPGLNQRVPTVLLMNDAGYYLKPVPINGKINCFL